MDIEKLMEKIEEIIHDGRTRPFSRSATARAVLAVALASAAEDWIAVAQSGFETWKVKPHNARWFRKIDGTPIPNDLTICIGEAFAERFRTLAAQLGDKTDG